MAELTIRTPQRTEMVDITSRVQALVEGSGVRDGLCVVFVPHTTAAVTINEGADPAVKADILAELDKVIPRDDGYAHLEGNSAGHIKTSITGASETIIISGGRLALGTWQAIYFCEFDGPRRRKVLVKCVSA